MTSLMSGEQNLLRSKSAEFEGSSPQNNSTFYVLTMGSKDGWNLDSFNI